MNSITLGGPELSLEEADFIRLGSGRSASCQLGETRFTIIRKLYTREFVVRGEQDPEAPEAARFIRPSALQGPKDKASWWHLAVIPFFPIEEEGKPGPEVVKSMGVFRRSDCCGAELGQPSSSWRPPIKRDCSSCGRLLTISGSPHGGSYVPLPAGAVREPLDIWLFDELRSYFSNPLALMLFSQSFGSWVELFGLRLAELAVTQAETPLPPMGCAPRP